MPWPETGDGGRKGHIVAKRCKEQTQESRGRGSPEVLELKSLSYFRRKWACKFRMALCCCVSQPCQTLCDPIDCSLLGSSAHGILQARTLEWVAIPFSRGSSHCKNWTQVSCIAGRFFTVWATRKPMWGGGCVYRLYFGDHFTLYVCISKYQVINLKYIEFLSFIPQ